MKYQLDSIWDISRRYTRLLEHYLPIHLEDFEDYDADDEIKERFAELLEAVVTDKLL